MPNTNIYYNSGYVGIGTSSPSAQLHVFSTSSPSWLTVESKLNAAYAGIQLKTWYNSSNATSQIYMDYYGATGTHGLNYISGRSGFASHWFKDNFGNVMMCILNGYDYNSSTGVGFGVGIGTKNLHGYTLAVNGPMIATQVVVKTYANWPDFVFQQNHKLMSLPEIEGFIKTYKHLPGNPTASEVSDKGIDVGTMQTKLLQKVEELTLLLIEQNKKNEALAAKVDQMEGELKTIKSSK